LCKIALHRKGDFADANPNHKAVHVGWRANFATCLAPLRLYIANPKNSSFLAKFQAAILVS
jgi:hypothetical protein